MDKRVAAASTIYHQFSQPYYCNAFCKDGVCLITDEIRPESGRSAFASPSLCLPLHHEGLQTLSWSKYRSIPTMIAVESRLRTLRTPISNYWLICMACHPWHAKSPDPHLKCVYASTIRYLHGPSFCTIHECRKLVC